MSDEKLDQSGHPRRHEWVWAQPIKGRDPEDDHVRVADEPGDIKCKHCSVTIPGDEYYALVAMMRKDSHLKLEEHAERFADRLELMALKYDTE